MDAFVVRSLLPLPLVVSAIRGSHKTLCRTTGSVRTRVNIQYQHNAYLHNACYTVALLYHHAIVDGSSYISVFLGALLCVIPISHDFITFNDHIL